MLGFQNKALDIKLLKFYANRDNWACIKKCDFRRKLVYQIWDCYWIRGVEMSLGVVLDLDFINCQTVNFINCLEKCEVLKMNSNIDIWYTIKKYFSPRVWIQNRHLKMRLRLSRINWQNLLFWHKKECRRSRHFRHERRVLFWWEG